MESWITSLTKWTFRRSLRNLHRRRKVSSQAELAPDCASVRLPMAAPCRRLCCAAGSVQEPAVGEMPATPKNAVRFSQSGRLWLG